MKKISIVLPTYNGERYLAEAIQSVLDQTCQNWELILVDDCSTDRTPEMIRCYTEQDSRIRTIRNAKNQRLPRSLNIGFRHATGDYFTWTSDDNRYKPNALERMLECLEADDEAGLVYCDMDFIDGEGNKTGSLLSEARDIYHINCIGACFLYRREAAEQIGEYDPSMVLVEDYDYWLRIARRFRVIHIPGCFYEYRRHEASLSERKAFSVRQQLNKLRTRELDFLLPNIELRNKVSMFAEMWLADSSKGGHLKKFFLAMRACRRNFNGRRGREKWTKTSRLFYLEPGCLGESRWSILALTRSPILRITIPD